MQKELAEALLKKFEERPQLQGGLDGVCRLLLAADTYSVPLLRDHCLHRLAARFADLAARIAPQHEQNLFAQFLQAIVPTVRALSKLQPAPLILSSAAKSALKKAHYRHEHRLKKDLNAEPDES